eukprot:6798074-Prymnesium_polylepis.2
MRSGAQISIAVVDARGGNFPPDRGASGEQYKANWPAASDQELVLERTQACSRYDEFDTQERRKFYEIQPHGEMLQTARCGDIEDARDRRNALVQPNNCLDPVAHAGSPPYPPDGAKHFQHLCTGLSAQRELGEGLLTDADCTKEEDSEEERTENR